MSEPQFVAGEEVALWRSHYSEPTIAMVSRVTPSGLVVVGKSTFNKNGYLRGGSSYSSWRISKLTDELRRRAIRADHLNRIKCMTWQAMTDEALAKVGEIINDQNSFKPNA